MFRIGEFAKLAGVTVRALRHYQALRLLEPARVDEATGYRFYSTDQLTILDKLLALRDLGFPLRETRALLEGKSLQAQLAKHRGRLTVEVERQTARLRRLLALERAIGREPGAPELGVRLRPIPAQRALTLRGRGPAGRLFEEAEKLARTDRLDASPFLLLHGPRDVEACVPVRASSRLANVNEIEGAKVAGSLVFVGSYAQTDTLEKRLRTWLEENGLRRAGPLREVYHRFGADQRGYRLPEHRLAKSSELFVTELQLPAEEMR
jgi:DNA-binding transcriptional MerR regulator